MLHKGDNAYAKVGSHHVPLPRKISRKNAHKCSKMRNKAKVASAIWD